MEFARRALVAAVAVALAAGLPGCRRRPPAPRAPAGSVPVAAPAERTETLRGEVVDSSGGPVPGARVLALAAGESAPAEAITDATGRFVLERLRPGRRRLLVEAPGLQPAELAAVDVPGAPARVRLSGEARAIAGRVAVGGAPAPGARVRISGEGGEIRDTVADADGSFRLGGLGAGSYAVRAARGDLVSATATAVVAGGGAAASPPALRLDLQPGVLVGGRVLDDRGRPLSRAAVRLERAADDPLAEQGQSAADGGFRLGPLAPGDYRAVAALAGYVQRRAVTARLAAGAPAAPIALELVRGAAITGRVADARGGAVAAATVRCVAAGVEDLAVLAGPLPLAAEASALPPGAGHALGTTRAARTDAAGRFAIQDLLPGRFRLEVAREGAMPLRTAELPVAPGERRDAGTLVLEDGVPVSGQVLDEAGGPLAGARVTIGDLGLYALTDGAGAFAASVAPGKYKLTATAPGLAELTASVDVGPGGPPPPPVMFRLVRADGKLEGVVRDEGGRPLVRAHVVALGAQPEGGEPRTLGSAVTDAGGHFAIARIAGGALQVEVRHPDYPVTTAAATPGTLVMVTVPIPGRVDGEVRERGGAPVARARVEARGPDGRAAAAVPRRGGAFTLPRLAPGRWRVTATAPGFRAADRELDVPPSASLGDPSVRDLRLELDPER